MYKILKDKGNNSNIYLENTETTSQLNLGKMTMTLLGILEKEGYSFGTDESDIKLNEEWDFEIKEETKSELEKMAMRMTKPIRDQSNQSKSEQKKKKNKKIDAMDVLLGLASYNK